MALTEAPQVFRNALTFRNSPATILRFPFPFEEDHYRSSVNLEPHDRRGPGEAYHALFDIDEHYEAEIAERSYLLARDPLRCQVMPHMMQAEWDTLALIMTSLAQDFPKDFSLHCRGDNWHWHNYRLGLKQSFVFGDPLTLPCAPFAYITRQVQGDFTLQDQREGNLWMDGGMVTAAQGWSFDFIFGMNWHDWHGPVTTERERHVIDRALQATMGMQPGQALRRPNWVIVITPRLDKSLETLPEWIDSQGAVPQDQLPDQIFLRVELQQLFRLPRSHAILFAIRNYMISLRDLARVPNWSMRLHRVLRDLDPAIGQLKGVPQREDIVSWLAPLDDGRVLPTGRAAGITLAELQP